MNRCADHHRAQGTGPNTHTNQPMNNPTNPPPHPLEVAAALVLLALEVLRPVLVHGVALVLILARWRPAVAAAGAAAPLNDLAPDCTPAPRAIARSKPQRRSRTTKGAPCSI